MYEASSRDFTSHCTHAELAAIKNVKGRIDSVFVYRENRLGNACAARPCLVCQALLIERGIRQIYYTDRDGKVQKEKL